MLISVTANELHAPGLVLPNTVPVAEGQPVAPAVLLRRPPSSDRTLLLVACAWASSRMAASMSPRRSYSWDTPVEAADRGRGWQCMRRSAHCRVLQDGLAQPAHSQMTVAGACSLVCPN